MCIENSTGILPDSGLYGKGRETGGILHLPDALRLYPEKRMILYNRTSGYGKQTGKDRSNLDEKEAVLHRAVRHLTNRPLKAVVSVAGECGKLSASRPRLISAAQDARKYKAMLVAYDLSRFLRPAAYDPRTNSHAEPTPDEFELLHEMTFGVVLATVLPPWLPESDRQSYLTKRTGKAGRPRSGTWDRVPEVFAALGGLGGRDVGGCIVDAWETPIRAVADMFSVGVATITAVIHVCENELSPDGVRTYRQAAIDLAREHYLTIALDKNGCPWLPPLSSRAAYGLRKAEMNYRRLTGPHFGEPDMRYKVNRQEGVKKDGTPDRRFKRNRSE